MSFEVEKTSIRFKHSLCVFLAVVMALGCISPCASAVSDSAISLLNEVGRAEGDIVNESYFVFTLNSEENSYSITDCDTSVSGEIVIPALYNGLPVTNIGEYAFENCKDITAVTIENGVAVIGSGAFTGCASVVSVSIPESVVRLDASAFNGCESLTSVVIPDGITNINYELFANCTSLATIVIPVSVTKIGSEAFINCKSIKSVYYGGSKEQWTAISMGLSNEGLTAAQIHYNVENGDIENHLGEAVETQPNCTQGGMLKYVCLCGYEITEIISAPLGHIPEEEWIIDKEPSCAEDGSKYHHCLRCDGKADITKIPANGHNYVNGICTVCNADEDFEYTITDGIASVTGYTGKEAEIVIPSTYSGLPVTHIASYAFESCITLTSVTIPDSITTIGRGAFKDCTNLISVTIPDNVTTMEQGAFAYCANLETVEIGTGISKIERSVFKKCEKLHTVIIPSSVTSMAEYAFLSCDKIKNVYYDGNKAQWNTISFGTLNSHLTTSTIHYYVDLANWESHWGEPVSKVAPTCTKNGSETFVCPCAYQTVKTIDALGHNYSATIKTHKPTCDKAGYRYKACVVCGNELPIKKVENILVDSKQYPESEHDYANDISKTYKFKYEGAKSLKLTFSAFTYTEPENDIIYIYDEKGNLLGEYSGDELSGKAITIDGSAFSIKLASNKTEAGYGFSLNSIVAVVESIDEIAPVGHTVGTWKIDKANRTQYKVCSVCKARVDEQKIPLVAPELTKIELSSDGIKITWGKTAYAEGYHIYRKASDTGNWKKIDSVKGNATVTYTDKGVESGKTYAYKLMSYAGEDLSDYSVTALKQQFLSAPALRTIENTSSGIKVTWGKVSGATSYNIYRKVKGGSWSYLANTKNVSYVDKTAKSGTSYYYTVSAKVSTLLSKYNTTGLGLRCVATPKLTKIENVGSTVKITWGKVAGADGYYVYRNASGVSGWKKVATIKSNSTVVFKDKDVASGKSYTYRLEAYSGIRASAQSTTLKIDYLAQPVISKVANADKAVKITWGNVKGADGYYVYRKAPGETAWKKIATVDGNTYSDTKVSSGKVYTYTVKAYIDSTTSYYASSQQIRYLAMPKLTKVTSTISGVKFTWGKVAGADGYYVYRKSRLGDWTKIATVKSGTSYLDKSAKEGKTYYYTVIAYKGTRLSAYNTTGLKIKDIY